MPEIIDCNQIDDEFTSDLGGKNTARLTWRVKTDGRMRADEVLFNSFTATPEPVVPVGTYLGNGVYVLQTPIRLEHPGNKCLWIVTAEGGPWPTDTSGTPGDGPDPETGLYNHPLKRKVIWSVERMVEQEPVEFDAFGIPIVNSAGKQFDIPYFRERHLPVLVAQKNFETLDEILSLNATYENKVNSTTWRGYAAWQAKFLGAEVSQPQYEQGIEFYTATMRFGIKPSGNGWQPSLLNRGYQYYDRPKTDPAARLKTVGDGMDQPSGEAANLALDGTLLPVGAAVSTLVVVAYESTDQFPIITQDPT